MSSASSSSSGPSSPTSSATLIDPTSPSLGTLSLKDITDEDRATAAELKKLANTAFGANAFAEAAKLYGQAIEKNPLDSTLFCNRAYTRMKMEENGYAIADATRAIELDPKYVKAYYRRALCQLSIIKPQLALADLKMVVKLDPSNKLGKAQLEATQKLIKRMQFEAAIEMGEEESSIVRCQEVIKDGGCEIDRNYTGPMLEKLPPSDPSSTQVKYKITQ
ncbi:hypothetical protein FRC01_006869, partial [Tulasnella sp. 417]